MPKKIGTMTLYTLDEISKKLGITERTLRTYIHTGRLHAQKWGTKWFISSKQLEDYQHGTTNLETAVRQRVQELSPPPEKPARKKQAARKRQKQKLHKTTTKTTQNAGMKYLLPDIIKGLRKKYGGYDAVAREIEKKTGRKYARKAVTHWTEQTRFPKPATLKDICAAFNLNYDELHRNMQEIKLQRKREKLLS